MHEYSLGEIGSALALSYTGIFVIDINTDSYIKLRSDEVLDGFFGDKGTYSKDLLYYIIHSVAPEYRDDAMQLLAPETVIQILSADIPVIEKEFRTINVYGDHWSVLAVSAMDVNDENNCRFLLTVRDVTARKKKDEENRHELQKSQEILQVLTTNTSEVFMIVDTQTQCLDFLSENVERLYGVKTPEISYTDDDMLYFKDLAVSKAIAQRIKKEWDFKSPYHISYIPVVNPVTNEKLWLSMHLYSVIVGGYNKSIIILNDVTDEKRQNEAISLALEDARQANSAKSSFLSNVSHDIRTPLNAIIGMTTLAYRHIDDKSRVRECLDRIELSSGNLLRLMNDILDIGRIESGRLYLNKSSFCISDMIDEVVAMLQPQAEAKGVGFKVSCHDVFETQLFTDYVQMEKVLTNIIGNAVKYTNSGGSVEFEVSQVESEKEGKVNCHFIVRDTGIGMKKEFLPNMFEVFIKERPSMTSSEKGYGLGMAITKSIVDLMSGTINVESEYGVGTTFTVILPVELPIKSSNELQHKRHGNADASFEGMCLLLAEDNDTNIEIATLLLNDMGAVVEVAKDGQIAVDKYKNSREGYYDAILMDVQMPNKNGYEAVMEIRQFEKGTGGHIPIVAMTANAFSEDVSKALSVGMDAHISKPVDYVALSDILVHLIKS